MNVKGLIFAVVETVIKVVVLAAAVMLILKGINKAYDFGYRVFADEPVSANNGRTITVGVAENATASDIADMLEEKGLIKDAKLFLVQERLSSYHDELKPGIYDLSTGMTANEMMQIMAAGPTEAPDTEEEPEETPDALEEDGFWDEMEPIEEYAEDGEPVPGMIEEGQ